MVVMEREDEERRPWTREHGVQRSRCLCHPSLLSPVNKPMPRVFPGGPVVENLPASARDTHRLIPNLGRFRMPRGQLDPWAATTATCNNCND